MWLFLFLENMPLPSPSPIDSYQSAKKRSEVPSICCTGPCTLHRTTSCSCRETIKKKNQKPHWAIAVNEWTISVGTLLYSWPSIMPSSWKISTRGEKKPLDRKDGYETRLYSIHYKCFIKHKIWLPSAVITSTSFQTFTIKCHSIPSHRKCLCWSIPSSKTRVTTLSLWHPFLP